MEVGERKDPVERYLPESCDTQRESALVRSIQPSLARRARFTSFIFLRPNPPRALGMQKVFQDFNERFLVFEEEKPHHKFLKDLSNWLQMLEDSKKELMAYEGMAATTDLISMSLPA
jgi:hypothetical protein